MNRVTFILFFLIPFVAVSQNVELHGNFSHPIKNLIVNDDNTFAISTTYNKSEVKIWDLKNRIIRYNLNFEDIFEPKSTRDIHARFLSNSTQIALFSEEILLIYDFQNPSQQNKIALNHFITQGYYLLDNFELINNDTALFIEKKTTQDKHYLNLFTIDLMTLKRTDLQNFVSDSETEIYHLQKTQKGMVYLLKKSNELWLCDLTDCISKIPIREEYLNDIEYLHFDVSENQKYCSVHYGNDIDIIHLKSNQITNLKTQRDICQGCTNFHTRGKFSKDEAYFIYLDGDERVEQTDRLVFYNIDSQVVDYSVSDFYFTDFIPTQNRIITWDAQELYALNNKQTVYTKLFETFSSPDFSALISNQTQIAMALYSSVIVFNYRNGERNGINISSLPNSENYFRKISCMAFHKNSIFVVSESQNYKEDYATTEVFELDAETLQVKNYLDTNIAGEFDQILINKSNSQIILKNKTDTSQIKILIELATFKNVPVFENAHYDFLLTNQDKIFAFISHDGTYVFDKDSYQFLGFYKEVLYFENNGKSYRISPETKQETITGFDEMTLEEIQKTIVVPTENLLILSDGNQHKLKVGEDITYLLDCNSNIQADITNNQLNFYRNGFRIFELNLVHLSYKKGAHQLLDNPVVKTQNGFFRVHLNQQENQTELIFSKKSNFKKYQVITALTDTQIQFINDNYIAVKLLPINTLVSFENDEDGNIQVLTYEVYEEIDLENPHAMDFYELPIQRFCLIGYNPNHKIYQKIGVISEKVLDNAFLASGQNVFIEKQDYYKNNRLNAIGLLTENGIELNSEITRFDAFDTWEPLEDSSSEFEFWFDENSNSIVLENLPDTTKNARMLFLSYTDFILFFDDNYYMSTPRIFDYIWFSKNNKIYKPEQFDLKYNRPDVVMQRLGAEEKVIESYNKLYQKRLKKLNINPSLLENDEDIPKIEIQNFERLPLITPDNLVDVQIQAQDEKTNIKTLNIWINDTPLFGAEGLDVSDKKTKKYKQLHTIPLANGINKIQISVLNNFGVESAKESVLIESTAEQKKPNLYMISVGVSHFNNPDYDLKYASKDANDVQSLFVQSDLYDTIYTKSLTDSQVNKESIQEISDFLKDATINDVVIVFIATHGLLDANQNYFLAAHPTDFDNPESGGIPFDAIYHQLDLIKPLKKIMLIDACHSGEVEPETIRHIASAITDANVTGRGAFPINLKKSETSEITSNNWFVDLRRGNGTTVIAASGGLEFAYESEQWNNGLFTYCLLFGIKSGQADLNNDGKIMLNELQSYITYYVKKLSNGQQTPTFRSQNLAFDYRIW